MKMEVLKIQEEDWHQRLTLVLLDSWEAEIHTISVQGQPRQIVSKTPFQSITG
jgi:hypothetical protein